MRICKEKQGFRICVSPRSETVRVDHLRQGATCKRLHREPHELIVLGEVIGEHGARPPEHILDDYMTRGPASFRELNGAFIVVLLTTDETSRASRIQIVTDRLNALKCFAETGPDGEIVLVSSLCFLPDRPRTLDPIGMVSYLCNGAVLNHHTLLDGVRVLPRASTHTVSSSGLVSTRYWELRLTAQHAARSDDDLCEEWAALIEQAVRRFAADAPLIYVSLSGGDDSTCILGCLHALGHQGVKAFSYLPTTAIGMPDTDADVAARRARLLGVEHAQYISFRGDPISVLRDNVDLSEGRANLCLEWDALREVQGHAPADAIFVAGDEWIGDECGWAPLDRSMSAQDVLRAAFTLTSAAIAPFADLFALREAAAAFDAELHELYMKAADPVWVNATSALYLDLRLSCFTMPWRELFMGHRHRVRNPLLDRDVLDFTTRLSPSQRLRKRLYRVMVRRRFPELFAIPRASARPAHSWPAAIQRSRQALERSIATSPSPGDRWISPTACLALLDLAKGEPDRASPGVRAFLVLLRALAIRDFAKAYVAFDHAVC